MSNRSAFVRAALFAAAVLVPRALAQESLWPSFQGDGTVMAQTLLVKQSSGSAELCSIDLGPPGPPISGIQSTWLEWNPSNVYLGSLNGTIPASVEVTHVGNSIVGCIGAATLDGGFVVTNPGPSSIRPVVGAFLWTPTQLFVWGINGPTSCIAVCNPACSAWIPNVQGVVVLDSYVWDYSGTVGVVSPAIQASALVYTPSNVYLVQATIGPGGIVASATDVFTPLAAPITLTRGAVVLAGNIDFSSSPPTDVQAAAILWNPGHLYLFQKGPAPSLVEIFDPSALPMAGCWGAMRIAPGMTNPTRAGAMVWQTSQASVLTIDPGITVSRATLPPGNPFDPPLVSGVNVPASGTPLMERQASNLFEIMGSLVSGGQLRRALIVGQSQRRSP